MRRAVAWIAACALVAASSGCAASKAEMARRQRLEAELDALRYPQPPAEVWQEVRKLLAERGYPLAGADAEAVGERGPGGLGGLLSKAKETHPYREDAGLLRQLGIGGAPPAERKDGSVSLDTDWSRREGDRVHVDGLVEPGGFRVIFTRIAFDQTDLAERASRGLELELALAKRIDPQVAERIESSVASGPSR